MNVKNSGSLEPLFFTWLLDTLKLKYMCNRKWGEKVNAKMGRPTNNPRVIQTRIRMSEEEAEMLEECAKALNTTKTEVIINGIKKVYADIKK